MSARPVEVGAEVAVTVFGTVTAIVEVSGHQLARVEVMHPRGIIERPVADVRVMPASGDEPS